jgi:VWFA-related protein
MVARFSTWIAVVVVFAVAFAVPVVPAAQTDRPATPKVDDGQAFKFAVGANLVIVPVIVTDKTGAHISGLKAEDFELKEEGTVEKIVRLDELTGDVSKIERRTAGAKTFSNELIAEHPKKLEIIALDQVNTPFASVKDGSRALVEFFSKNVDANTLVALVSLGHNGPRVIHDFTTDTSVLVAAVQKVKTRLNSRDATTLEVSGDNSQADVEALQLAALLNGGDPGSVTTPAQFSALGRAQRAQIDASRQAQEGLITLENFQALAQYFGGVDGRKSLIWASTGFPFSLGANAQSNTRGTTNDDWQRTFRMLNEANISVYPVDIGGLLPGVSANTLQTLNSNVLRCSGPEGCAGARSQQLSAVESGAFTDLTVGKHTTMQQVAEMTGGQAFYNSNDGAELFRRAGQDASQYYMLAYYTKDTGKYGWRKLSVKVQRDGAKIRARSGFFFGDPKAGTDPQVSLKELKMAMNSDLSFTSVPLKGQWLNVEPSGSKKKVHFALTIPAGVSSIDTQHQNHISLEFLVVATDGTGKVAGNISQRFDTQLPPEGVSQIQQKGLDYANALTLPPGSYTVRFVVRDNLRGTLGSMSTPLKVE